jgi:hypothetical protein
LKLTLKSGTTGCLANHLLPIGHVPTFSALCQYQRRLAIKKLNASTKGSITQTTTTT